MNTMLAFVLVTLPALGFDSTLLQNNKETRSRLLTKKDFAKVSVMTMGQPELLVPKAMEFLSSTMNEFETYESSCDLGLARLFQERALTSGLIRNESEYPTFLKFLRTQNLIDDLFYKILSDSQGVLSQWSLRRRFEKSEAPRQFLKELDLTKIFAPFLKWPDDKSDCSLAAFTGIVRKLEWKNKQERDERLEVLHQEALRRRIISEETFRKLETFRMNHVTDWGLYTYEYLEVVGNAKDKLTKSRETLPLPDPKLAERKEKLTQRMRLYQVYDSTHVMVLAELIGKTAKRMDALQVTLNFQFRPEGEETPETEIYVFSPMEQYRISINMLRKDMAELMRSETFRGKGIEFEDLVAAAYETGLIRTDELEYILKFEDFWNPKKPRWRTYTDFVFSIAGTASFYLPAPWSIVGAIALVVTQSRVNGKPKPDADDNWNVII